MDSESSTLTMSNCLKALSLLSLLPLSVSDLGTAAFYGPPYLPTTCYFNDTNQFPQNNLFAAAGPGIWDNGAACGRQYSVRCISSAIQNACIKGRIIQVKVVDRGEMLGSIPSKNGTTLVLSATAYDTIASRSAEVINVEFTQV